MPKRTLSKRVSRLEKTTRPEVKHKQENSAGFQDVGSVQGTLLYPQQLAQSAGRSSRIGDKVKTRNIRFQSIFKMPNNASNGTCAVRILVLRCKIQDPGTSDMPNWYEPVDEDKFFVVKDILTQVSLGQGRTVDGDTFNTGSTLKNFKFNIPVGLRKMQYDGAANMSPLNNEYVIYMLAENQSAEVAYNWRHYFIDN